MSAVTSDAMDATTIGGIFAKDVARQIEGVIKADDAAHLGTEVDEYVLTGETATALSSFLETYTAPVHGGGNGVWISGFFGSGKSHLLKMLAHLMGDVPLEADDPGRAYSRQQVVDAFTQKAEGDSMLVASLAKAARIPATCLLFNIDQKAPLIDKNQTDALLQVFVKVFNEARGYYPGDPSVARFERDLDRRGLLGRFHEAFAEIAGVPWEQGREESIFHEDSVTRALAQVTGEPAAERVLGRYEEHFSLSIEDFADEVAEWLDERPADHRLLFMVDEVGQFIGTNTRLMLNLQTIVESLNTRCGGRAWVCVTSQEDMDKVLGDRTAGQANDFSKIQARFAVRMKLTSRDVEEVIEKRLLGKNPDGEAALDRLYDEQRANFRTLFDFTDGARAYKNYESRERFTDMYPFAPYQFSLFQKALVGLSDHNAFEGRHSSVGERSMLGVVQDTAKQLVDRPVGSLVPFDLMYSGIGQTVKAAAVRSIAEAQRHLPEGSEITEIAVRVLKALFLVKYVDEFAATAHNLSVLLYDHFTQDITALTRQVTEALELLEQQSYVQRAGELYEYLTDEEQDIEKEIKNTEVGQDEVAKLLAGIISEDVVTSPVFRHESTGRDFRYELRLDEASFGRTQPLAVHYITSALGLSEEEIMAQSMGRDEVRVLLPDDPRLYTELRLHVQTERYVRRRNSSSLTETQRRILGSKSDRNRDRRCDLAGRVRDAIDRAEFVINGAQIPVRSAGATDRVTKAVGQLVARTYTQLTLLDGVAYTESQVRQFLDEDPALLDRDHDRLQPAADEVAAFITTQRQHGINATVKTLVEHFEGKPYGWPLAAILCAIARLSATSQVALSKDGGGLKRTELSDALLNGREHGAVVVSPQRQFDPAAVQRLRTFAQDFFARSGLPGDPVELITTVAELLAEERRDLKDRRDADSYPFAYPFLELLDEPIILLDQVCGKPAEWYLEELPAHMDALLEAKQEAIDPVLHFLAGHQKRIYDDAARLLAENTDNLAYLPGDQIEDLRTLLGDPHILRGQGMSRLKKAAASLRESAGRLLTDEKEQARAAVSERMGAVHGSTEWAETNDEARAIVTSMAVATAARIDRATSVPVIRQVVNDFSEDGYAQVLSLIEAGRTRQQSGDKQAEGQQSEGKGSESSEKTGAPTVPPVTIVPLRGLLHRRAGLLRSTADADAYVEELRDLLHEAIENGKQVSL